MGNVDIYWLVQSLRFDMYWLVQSLRFDMYWLVQSLRFDMSGWGDVCRIVSISVFCAVAIIYPVFISSPTIGQKTVAPSVSL
jgi:hypothetical protein